MCERKRLVTNSFLKVPDDEKSAIGELKDTEMEDAINRFLKDKKGYDAADMFIRKLRAITGVMSNSEQAAHLARKRMFSMIAKFGSPSLLFTITPDDNNESVWTQVDRIMCNLVSPSVRQPFFFLFFAVVVK